MANTPEATEEREANLNFDKLSDRNYEPSSDELKEFWEHPEKAPTPTGLFEACLLVKRLDNRQEAFCLAEVARAFGEELKKFPHKESLREVGEAVLEFYETLYQWLAGTISFDELAQANLKCRVKCHSQEAYLAALQAGLLRIEDNSWEYWEKKSEELKRLFDEHPPEDSGDKDCDFIRKHAESLCCNYLYSNLAYPKQHMIETGFRRDEDREYLGKLKLAETEDVIQWMKEHYEPEGSVIRVFNYSQENFYLDKFNWVPLELVGDGTRISHLDSLIRALNNIEYDVLYLQPAAERKNEKMSDPERENYDNLSAAREKELAKRYWANCLQVLESAGAKSRKGIHCVPDDRVAISQFMKPVVEKYEEDRMRKIKEESRARMNRLAQEN